MRKIEAHDPVVNIAKCGENLEVCWRATQSLHIHTPFFRIELVCLKRSCHAQILSFVNELIAAIIPGTRVALRVLVTHDRPKGLQNCCRCEVFRSNEVDAPTLAIFLELDNVVDFRVDIFQI